MRDCIDKIIKNSIANGENIGAGCLIFKDNKEIYSGFFGHSDIDKNIPMSRDHIFRLFSLTKPITSAAAMILTDRGIISPDDPVSKFFPEFSNISYVNDKNEIVPCNIPITVSHLLNMTSGLPYADNWGTSVCASAKLFDAVIDGQRSGNEITTEEFCRRAADIPLMIRPGELWDYGISADILGGIIEQASGMKLSEFLKQNIFEPLGMNDTGFYVPTNKMYRFTALYSWQENGLRQDHGNYLGLTDYSCPPAFESGGAGLVSTIDDYSKFSLMLASGGEFMGKRLFSRKTFEYMTSPKLSESQVKNFWERLRGYNYSCLMRIMTDKNSSCIKTCNGEFGWDGWTGTYFCADPVNNIVCLYFTQICGGGTTKEAAAIANTVFEKLL